MNAKLTVYLLFLLGSVLLIAIWAWALADGVKPLLLTLACVATALLCLCSAAITTRKIRQDARLSVGDVASAGMMIAVAPAVIGACILIWEHVPSRSGQATQLDRRYALLFLAIAVYLFLFPLIARQKEQ
jgi:hypothetical protein